MKLSAAAIALAVAFCIPSCVAVASEVAWEREFHFSALPTELDVGWKQLGQGETVIDGDLLRLTSPTDGGCYFVSSVQDGIWNAEESTTVEFRARVVHVDTGSDAAAHIIFKTDQHAFVYNLTNPEFKTFRVLLEAETAYVFDVGEMSDPVVLKAERLEREVHPDSVLYPNSIGFGDYSYSIGGTSEWEFLRWTNNGAFPPPAVE